MAGKAKTSLQKLITRKPVLLYISPFGFYHQFNSSPKATDCKLSSDHTVLIDVLHSLGYCFYERGGVGVMEMLINFLFNHTPPRFAPPHPTYNSSKD
ncbi:hypothetical protein ACTXT7_014264 [Hymenolepis weldensis]